MKLKDRTGAKLQKKKKKGKKTKQGGKTKDKQRNGRTKGLLSLPYSMNFWKTSEGEGGVISDPKNYVFR